MTCFPRFFPRRSAANGVLLASVIGLAFSLVPGWLRGQTPVDPAAANAGFFTARTVLWLGRSQVIPVRLSAPASADELFEASPADASAVEVLRQPIFLAGESTAYLRVRGLRAGSTKINLRGGSAIEVKVKPDPSAAAMTQIDPGQSRPRIVSPAPGSLVCGEFAVGVEVFDATERTQSVSVTSNAMKVQLRLPDGRLLDSVSQTGPEFGPARQFAFNVSASDLPVGPAQLIAVVTPPGFTDVDRRSGRGLPSESEVLALRVIPAPAPDAVWSDECETALAETAESLSPARPGKFGTRQPQTRPDPNASGGKTLACPGNDPAWCLPFVVKQPGDYQLFLRMRGDFASGAFPTIALYLNDSEKVLGLARMVSSKYQRLPVGPPIPLDAGPQIVTVQFRNDFNGGKEDRNAYFDRYELIRVGDSAPPPAATADKSKQPPSNIVPTAFSQPAAPTVAGAGINANGAAPVADARLNLLYPANGANVFGVDAVVARLMGSAPLAWADVFVDGQSQDLRCQNPPGGDALVFPLLLRGLPPGAHQLTVRGADRSGQPLVSFSHIINVLAAPPAAPGSYERALRLLDRLAYGPEPQELAAVLTLGEAPWLNDRLGSGFDSPTEQAVLRTARARYPKADDRGQTTSRALHQWMASNNPVRTRFTAWAENHFSTWINKTDPAPKWDEHFDFCRLGIAPFADLLAASAYSPAMLTYLDQEKSYASKLNENYAREIMELHTLGVHGGYKQADVTALAGILNGWTLSPQSLLPEPSNAELVFNDQGNEAGLRKDFRFTPALNDGKPRRVFGIQFSAADPTSRYDRARFAIEMLAAHPRTANHVCRQLAEHYVGVPAPDGLVKDMARAFLETGGDMRSVLRVMAGHPAFWQAPAKLATPLDFGLRVARLCRAAAVQTSADPDQAPKADQIENFLKKSGMGLFDRVSPDGYPENSAAYADSNALLQRWRFTQTISEPLNRLIPLAWRVPSAVVKAGDSDSGTTFQSAADPAQHFIDLAAVRFTGRLLSATSNQAARDVLGEPNPDRMRQTMVFISLLPEGNLR